MQYMFFLVQLLYLVSRGYCGIQFESSEETLKRLSLKLPDDKGAADAEKGTHVQLKDGSEKILVSMLLGKARETGGERSFPVGHYVRVGDGPTIYLIDTHFAHMASAARKSSSAF